MTAAARHTRVFAALAAGLHAATVRPALVTMLWLSHLALAFALALPVFRWLHDATAYRPAADVLADRFSFGWLAELLDVGGARVWSILQASVGGGLLVAVLVSPLLIAATLASLRNGSLGRRELGATALALYWPFLRVIVFGRGAALVAGGMTAASMGVLLRPLSESPWEAGFIWARVIQVGGAALVIVLLLAAVDFALVHIEAGRSRSAVRAWLAGLRVVITRPVLTVGTWAGAGVLLALAVGLFVALREITSRGGSAVPAAVAIGVTVAIQQAFMLVRTWLRVGLLGAEQHVVERTIHASSATPETVQTPTCTSQGDDAATIQAAGDSDLRSNRIDLTAEDDLDLR